MSSRQAPSAVVMVRPHRFTPNAETVADNVFQVDAPGDVGATVLARRAFDEVTALAEALRSHGVDVRLFDDTGSTTPDSVFPNNWFSTHHGGHVALYPMFSPSRRGERRADVVEMLKADFRVQDVIDYSGLEHDRLFLEGTGAMVLDHDERVAYVARSNRADPIVLERFCTNFGYEPMAFDAVDGAGVAIYHTNVLMCVAAEYALVGLDAITDAARRREVTERLGVGGREVVALSRAQLFEFAGNAFEMCGSQGSVLAMSSRAKRALDRDQLARIEAHSTVVAVDVPTIELAGGSVRCMLAGIHLTPRATPDAGAGDPDPSLPSVAAA